MLGTYAKGGSGTTAVGVATGIVAPGIGMSIFGIPTLSKVGFFYTDGPTVTAYPAVKVGQLEVGAVPRIRFRGWMLSPGPSGPRPLLTTRRICSWDYSLEP